MEEFFLPSEIARLVYGHLKRLKCDDIAEKFLNTSPHMKECAELKKKNLKFKTEVHGLSLEEILNQFLNMNELVLDNANSKIKNLEQKFKEPVSALKFILKLIDANKDTKKDNGSELNAEINVRLDSNEFEASNEVDSKIRRKNFMSNDDNASDDKQLNKSSSPTASTEPSVDLALIQQKLIENSKLHACLAANINKVINDSTLPTFSEELDVAIKKVADETVNDPLCDDIINGLLACVSNNNLLKDNAEEQDIDFPIEINNHEKVTSILGNLEQNTSVTIDTDDKNSRFEEMQEFVRFNNEDSSDIIVVRVPQNEQNVYSEHDYTVGDQNNLMHSDSVTSANLRNYIMCSSDIASTSDNEGSIINVYPEQKREDVIQLHSLENNGPYVIGQNIPLIVGNHAKIMINEKRTRRSRFQPLTTSANSRKWTPIAPKPCPEETQTNNKISENTAIKSKTRPVKKMKK